MNDKEENSKSTINTPSSQNGSSQSSGKGSVSSITSTPIQHKRLHQLLQEEGGKSPVLKIPASPLMTRLGYGTGVGVYMMERSPRASGEQRSPWAIKRLAALRKSPDGDAVYQARLEFEASILKTLEHPNIIGFRAFSYPNSGAGSFLAMEKASTSLADLIESRFDEFLSSQGGEMNPNPFPAKAMEKVGLDVAKALAYLHSDKKLIHGDLKSGNVLVFGDFETVKLCDFGVSRKLGEDGKVEGFYVGTECWNPMEVVLTAKGDTRYPITAKVDIYPYALTLFEMIALKPPHISTDFEEDPDLSQSDLESSYNETNQSQLSSSNSYLENSECLESSFYKRIGTRPDLPDIEFDTSYNKILEVFYCCSEEDPGKRPTATHIVALLENVPDEVTPKPLGD